MKDKQAVVNGFHADRLASEPIHEQLYVHLRRAMIANQLRPGAALPSTRDLARQLGIARNTVIAAYQQLIRTGLVTARSGSGTRVNEQPLRRVKLPDLLQMLADAHFPATTAPLSDPEGNPLHLQS